MKENTASIFLIVIAGLITVYCFLLSVHFKMVDLRSLYSGYMCGVLAGILFITGITGVKKK